MAVNSCIIRLFIIIELVINTVKQDEMFLDISTLVKLQFNIRIFGNIRFREIIEKYSYFPILETIWTCSICYIFVDLTIIFHLLHVFRE